VCEQSKILSPELEESIIQFLLALWDRAMQKAQQQRTENVEERAEVIHTNILKLNGFPVGELDQTGQAVRPRGIPVETLREAARRADAEGAMPGPSRFFTKDDARRASRNSPMRCRCRPGQHVSSCFNENNQREDVQQALNTELGALDAQISLAHSQRIFDFAARFVELQESGELEAIAGAGRPMNNAGLYRGRIAEIDPMRWRAPNRWAKPGVDHNMSNITFPVISDDLNDDELNELDDEVEDEVENPEMFADEEEPISEEMEGQSSISRVMIAIVEDEPTPPAFAPSKIGFSFDNDGLMTVESKASPLRAKESSWWRSLSPKAKRSYLERHPNSKYARAYRRKVEKKRRANKRLAGKGKDAVRVVKELDQQAEKANEQRQEEGLKPGEDVAPELTNEQDKVLDDLVAEMDAEQEANEGNTEDADGDSENDSEEEEEEEEEEPQIHAETADQLHEASKKKGFFTPVVNAVKQRASKSTLGSMKRMLNGTGDDEDKRKAIKGLALLASAIVVVGVGAGIGALAGPGPMHHYVAKFVEGGGFKFSGGDSASESASWDDDIHDESEEELAKAERKDKLSDTELEDLSKRFVSWLVDQSKKDQEEVKA